LSIFVNIFLSYWDKKGTGYFFGFIGLWGSFGFSGLAQKRGSDPSCNSFPF
jgi:hypothetical protein